MKQEKIVKTKSSKKKKLGKFFVLRLYVTGANPSSTRAIANIRSICQKHLRGKYDLQVIDLYQHPRIAKDEQIIAAPTLIKKLPNPSRRFVGDMSNLETILAGLSLKE
jgi:circadian clock protein KaiB